MADENDITDLMVRQEEISQDALEIIESRNKLWERVLQVALLATSSTDWIDQNGKPYLQATGAEKVARRFGVRIYDLAIDREDITDDKGRYYLYTVTGKAGFGTSDSIEAIGTCSSRDRFFGTKNKELKATEDVDIGNVKKKAYTNFIGNAITRLLGIRGLSWDDLKKYGITPSGKTQVKYGENKSHIEPESNFSWPPKCGAWDWKAPNGHHYVYAKLGKHYQVDFLKKIGMKPDEKDEKRFWGKFSEEIANTLIERFLEVEGA